ncbi:hypothetical protein MKW98_013400 [Papaver atlanticum]|uniref:E2 ubiquitin-conjugating enzyme n=1 Tax=Papaver atlanticum TaxID=357466 RepID=A0AAD4SSP9_9MAGN|nr:hypothetical protein MKW98_013400 [Papaver atlanticum]
MDVVEILKTSSSMTTLNANKKIDEGKESIMSTDDNSDLRTGAEPSVPLLVVEDKPTTDPTKPPVPQFQEVDDDEAILKYRSFKSFDTVEDFSDHHYKSYSVTQSKQTSQKWAKAIQQDWRLLEKDLPDTIFARAYEERMDLLRAVIVGAAGTPYHDGLFFFDIHYPSEYPDTPPLVNYHAHNLSLNPNLYYNGKVCLSLLNTWNGSIEEHWTPGLSTMLQVLLSIQALVLNEKPYFNEPGWAPSAGTEYGEKAARDYNETTFILSCKTMQYTLKNPPKYFEDYVMGHFRLRAYTILAACKAYIEGAQVGSVVEEVQDESQKNGSSEKEVGKVVEGLQDVNGGQKSGSSMHFKSQVGTMVGNLVPIFISKGAKNCEQFICLGNQAAADESQAQFQPFAYSPDYWPPYYSSDEYSPPYSPDQAQFPPFSNHQALFQPSAPWPVQAQFQPLAHSAAQTQFRPSAPRAQFQPFVPKPAQDQSQPVAHSQAQFQTYGNYPAQAQLQPLAHYPAQAQFQPLPHYPAQAQFQPSAHPQVHFQSFAHYLAPAQFQPWGHPQPQFQPLAHSQDQFQPLPNYPAQAQFPPLPHYEAQAQAQFRPLPHPQAQIQPLAHSQGQFQPAAHPQAQFQPLVHPQVHPSHSPAEAQFQPAHSFCTGGDHVQPEAPVQQPQAHAQAQAHFGKNYYHYY